ncbi:MAG: type II toxin-antitoxin system HicA family toxin [Coxiellaceae bacterium]|nr:type II toxin-antitoxin system HicA family toxin [Coxiellaceae bacterium]
MDGKCVIKRLKENGWLLVGVKGSHHKMKKSGKPPIVVPVHASKDLKLGTLHSIEKVTGVALK